MEVHAHAHTSRKKWTHYFWEFLMLFLAVTLGFFVENQREHYIEGKREKEFMRSMVDDLIRDTAEINYWLNRLERNIERIDSAIFLYAVHKDSKDVEIAELGKMGTQGTVSINITFTDRTSSQLKNSGGMRLIRNKPVADSIIEYWNRIEQYRLIHNRIENYRIDARKLGFKIFAFYPDLYVRSYIDSTFLVDSSGILINSPSLLGEYVNNLWVLGITSRTQFLTNLKRLAGTANNLIAIIKKEYRLE